MAREKILVRQSDFSAGVIDFDGRRRDDTKIHRAALRAGTNARPLAAGGVTDRPGRTFQFFDAGRQFRIRPVPDELHKISFGDGTFTARGEDNLVITHINGCPWSGSNLPRLGVAVIDNEIVVTHPTVRTRVLRYSTVTGEWTLHLYEFREEFSGTIRQPYFRYADRDITMTPSALTGSVTLTFSGNVLEAAHDNTRFRYFEFEMQITAVTNATTATATVTRALPATRNITVGTSVGFSEGDIVEGATSGTTGIVAAIPDGTHVHVVVETPGTDFDGSEELLGPTGRSTISAVNNVSPAALKIWDEQLVSDVRGWPRGVAADRSRLIFFDFPQVPRGVLWGEVGVIDSFHIGALPTDAFFETVPTSSIVRHVMGGADQFVFTDTGLFYIPISADAPLQPGSVEFRAVASEGAGTVTPVPTKDGMIFLNVNHSRVLAMSETGQTARPYIVEDISEYHVDLFSSPIGIAVSNVSGAQQLVYVLNNNGTCVVAKFNRAEEFVGWFPWRGEGLVRYIASDRGEVEFVVDYTEEDVQTVEAEGATVPLDCVIPATSPGTLDNFAGMEMAVYKNGVYQGIFEVSAAGVLIGYTAGTSGAVAGFPFETLVRPFVGNADGGESAKQRLNARSISAVAVTLNSTAAEIEFCGRLRAAYGVTESGEGAPVAKNQTLRARVRGRAHEPVVTVRRTAPGTLKILEFATEVSV